MQRPAIVGIDHDIDGDDAQVTVTLGWKDEHFFGHSVGTAEDAHRSRLAGEATLRAVEHLCRNEVALELMAVAKQQRGPISIALAQVRLGADEVMVGTAIIGDEDGEHAAVRAVMDAVNRRLGLILES